MDSDISHAVEERLVRLEEKVGIGGDPKEDVEEDVEEEDVEEEDDDGT